MDNGAGQNLKKKSKNFYTIPYASVGHRAIGLVKSTVLARNEMLISARLLTIRSFYKKVKNVAT